VNCILNIMFTFRPSFIILLHLLVHKPFLTMEEVMQLKWKSVANLPVLPFNIITVKVMPNIHNLLIVYKIIAISVQKPFILCRHLYGTSHKHVTRDSAVFTKRSTLITPDCSPLVSCYTRALNLKVWRV